MPAWRMRRASPVVSGCPAIHEQSSVKRPKRGFRRFMNTPERREGSISNVRRLPRNDSANFCTRAVRSSSVVKFARARVADVSFLIVVFFFCLTMQRNGAFLTDYVTTKCFCVKNAVVVGDNSKIRGNRPLRWLRATPAQSVPRPSNCIPGYGAASGRRRP